MPSGSPVPIADAAAAKPTHRLRTKMKSHLDLQEGAISPKGGFSLHCCCQGRRSLFGIATVFWVSGLHTPVGGNPRWPSICIIYHKGGQHAREPFSIPPALFAAIALRATSHQVIETTASRSQDVPALPGHERKSEHANAMRLAPSTPSHVSLLSAIAFPRHVVNGEQGKC